MKKTRIVYSLTERGLFSELSNLALAIVFARYMNLDIIVNTYGWCAKIKDGWTDYFKPTIKCCNSMMSSQYKIHQKGHLWIGKIYYDPSDYFNYYIPYIRNKIYLWFHPRTLLSNTVFQKMLAKSFIDGHKHLFEDYREQFKEILQYNETTKSYIDRRKSSLGLPETYISVHIRRGDKIATGEMNAIGLEKYIEKIKENIKISNNVYIATDDNSVVEQIKPILEKSEFRVFYNHYVLSQGYDQKKFNKEKRETRKRAVLDTLLDMDILLHSNFFIGTYSSNIGRIVPLYIGMDKCISLDHQWTFGEHFAQQTNIS